MKIEKIPHAPAIGRNLIKGADFENECVAAVG